MREYKFRGKDTETEEWLYGNLIGDDVIVGEIVDWDDEYFCTEFWRKVDPQTVGQYTGLKDSKKNEIYEGDIVKQVFHAEIGHVHDGTAMTYDGHHIGEVIITAYKGVCMRNPLCWSEETDETIKTNQYKNVAGYRCEKIGNRWDNPELLEG